MAVWSVQGSQQVLSKVGEPDATEQGQGSETETPAKAEPKLGPCCALLVSLHSLDIRSCELLGSALRLLPGQGLTFTISDSFIRVQGKWKVRKRFL